MKTFTAVLALFVCLSSAACAQAATSVRQLVRQADFVGFIQAEPSGIASQGEWRQSIFLTDAEGIKGSLSHDFGNHQYPWIKADHAGFAGYPTRFVEGGEYLVFLRRTGSTASWTTLAAYAVQYSPDGLGGMFSLQTDNVIGLLTNGVTLTPLLSQPVVTVIEARQWLVSLANGQSLAHGDEAKLDSFFHASLLSPAASLSQAMPTHEERMALAKKLAESVTLGMTRAQVEKIFPQSDGGAFGSDRGRYYFGSEVMIDVPYDTSGGPFQSENRVKGPLRVYRDRMHID